MNQRERIAKAMYEAPDIGDVTVHAWPPSNSTYREWWLLRADAALAAFAEALDQGYIPPGWRKIEGPIRTVQGVSTDDKRADLEGETLLRAIINAPESGDALHVAEAKRVRDAVLAAGFHRAPSAVEQIKAMPIEQVRAEIRARRTVQGEPKHDESCGERCNHCQVCGEGVLYGSRCPEHYLNQQGEPSEALDSILESVMAEYGDETGTWVPIDKVRAALRAAEFVHSYAFTVHNGEPSDAQVARYLYDHEYYVPEGLRAALRAAAETGGEHRG